MKKTIHSSVLIAVLILLWSCGGKTTNSDDMDDWKEMDDFHMVMADVFHPLKDSGNLDPIRLQAEDLAASAATWADAKLPGKVDNDEVRSKLTDLKAGTRELADQIKDQAPDSVVSQKLTALHDQFHKLQEAWHGGGHHHKH